MCAPLHSLLSLASFAAHESACKDLISASCDHPSLSVQDKSGTVYDEAGVAEDMLQFLEEFREAHESYFTAPLIITGESYGGVCLP